MNIITFVSRWTSSNYANYFSSHLLIFSMLRRDDNWIKNDNINEKTQQLSLLVLSFELYFIINTLIFLLFFLPFNRHSLSTHYRMTSENANTPTTCTCRVRVHDREGEREQIEILYAISFCFNILTHKKFNYVYCCKFLWIVSENAQNIQPQVTRKEKKRPEKILRVARACTRPKTF